LDERSAELSEMLQGSTLEQLDQARAKLAESEAVVEQASISLERLTLRAPRDGLIDALPYEVGERPQKGAVVAVMLAGDGPFARVYVPASSREGLLASTDVTVKIQGVKEIYQGKVRFVSREAAFTPYFALTEHDRDRLSYLAEIDLLGDTSALPTGMPVEVEF
jgi:HlyD family secretion protein